MTELEKIKERDQVIDKDKFGKDRWCEFEENDEDGLSVICDGLNKDEAESIGWAISDRARLVNAVEYLLNEIGPATGHLYSQEAQEQAVNSILKGE